MSNLVLKGVNKITEHLKVATYELNGRRFKVFMPVQQDVNEAVVQDMRRRMKNGL